MLDVAAVLRMGSTPHAAELSRPERSPTIKHRELPAISVKSGSTSSPTPPRSETTHLSPKSAGSPRKASPTHEVREELPVFTRMHLADAKRANICNIIQRRCPDILSTRQIFLPRLTAHARINIASLFSR